MKRFLIVISILLLQINLIHPTESESKLSSADQQAVDGVFKFSKQKRQDLITFIENKIERLRKGYPSKNDELLDELDDLNNYKSMFGNTGKAVVVLSNVEQLTNLLSQLKASLGKHISSKKSTSMREVKVCE